MGIYDREYYREDEPGPFGARSATVTLVLVNIAFFIANLVLDDHVFRHSLFHWMKLYPDLLTHPWQVYQLVSYGFAHEPNDLRHIVFNMLFLWFAGRDVEGIYGRQEFYRIYFSAVVIAGAAFVLLSAITGARTPVLGASGAVMAILALYVMHYPRRTILFMFFLPLPAWVVGLIYLAGEVLGFMNPNDNTAHVAHLAGAAFGILYFRHGWNLGRILPSTDRLRKLLRPRPRLRVHDPELDERDLSRRVDEILAKISRSGEASLTRQERRTLEEASRRYQRRQS